MQRHPAETRKHRGGFSLMEVLLASSILIGSLIVLNQLSNLGRLSAASTESMVTAQLFCEQQLNLMLTGVEPLEETDDTAWEDNEDWHYSVELLPSEKLPVTQVTVRVWQDEETFLRPQRFQLVRWVMLPSTSSDSEEVDDGEASESYLSELGD